MAPRADSASVRRHNLSLALRHIAAQGPCARTEIAEATGLVHASVSGLVTDLMERGLVREVGNAAPVSRGRPRRLLQIVPERLTTIAVQVSQECIHVLAADFAGSVVHRASVPHQSPYGAPEAVAEAIAGAVTRAAQAVETSCRAAHLAHLVIAMAGPVAPSDIVAIAIDFGWRVTDLRAMVAARLPHLPCPLAVVNDANVAALAEDQALAAQGKDRPDTVAYIKADTGVGGGLLINGNIHTGSHGMASEPGHIPLAMDGPACGCGSRGCMATYVGPEALSDAAGLQHIAHTHGIDAALAELDRRLRLDEPRAVAVLREAGERLGAAILTISSLTDAGEVILGGYLATWGPWLMPGLEARLAGRKAATSGAVPTITLGTLGQHAPLQGSLQVGRDAVLDNPTTVPFTTPHPD